MAQSSIRKGFFFYFGLLILLLVSAFLICLVIMMFNPGKTVLWMKYFSGKQEFSVKQTTAETKDGPRMTVDYSTINEIVVNCNYAKVTMQRNREFADDYVVIRNYAKGFSSAKKYSAFSHKVSLQGTKLVIDINEPTGFLYFSRDVEVIINDCVLEDKNKINLENIALTVNSKGKGDIYLGGTTNDKEKSFGLRSLDVKTDKGTITLGRMFNTSAVTGTIGTNEDDFGIRLYSKRGSIKAVTNVGIQNSNQNVAIGTDKGKINLDTVNVGGRNLQIRCKRGTVAIGKIQAGNVEVNDCINGNYKFDNVASDVTFNGAADTIISPIINIKDIAGEFRLQTNGKKDAPIVTIKNAQKKVAVTSSKGSVTVSNAKGEVELLSNLSMASKVTVDKNNTSNIRIQSEKGKVRLKFLGAVSADARIITNTSPIKVEFTKDASFNANCFKKDATTPMKASYVNVNMGNSGIKYEYDKEHGVLTFNGTTSRGKVTINTNDEVDFNLVSVS